MMPFSVTCVCSLSSDANLDCLPQENQWQELNTACFCVHFNECSPGTLSDGLSAATPLDLMHTHRARQLDTTILISWRRFLKCLTKLATAPPRALTLRSQTFSQVRRAVGETFTSTLMASRQKHVDSFQWLELLTIEFSEQA